MICDDRDGGPSLTLLTRAHDVAVTRRGTYVLSLANGVHELEACALERRAWCRDDRGAQRLRVRADEAAVDYLRADGSLAACDLTRSQPATPDARALPSLAAPLRVDGRLAELWIHGASAWLQPRGGIARALPLDAEALSLAVNDTHRIAAVGDAVGAVWLFTLPDGMLIERVHVHARNVTGVAFDASRERLLSVAGHGRFDARTLPASVRAWARATPR